MVTNQAGVARGLYGIDDVALVHKYIAEHLAEHDAHIDLFLFSPDHPVGVVEAYACASEDRKPGPGMAKAAAKALGLDLATSWVVGDRPEDLGLAEAIGASAVYLGPDGCERAGVYPFPSLAAEWSFHPGAHHDMNTVHDLPDLAPLAGDAPPRFPAAPYASAATYFSAYVEETARSAASVGAAAVARAAAILLDAYTRGATVFSCGNGGSASIANHLQCDHTKNVGNSTDLCPRVMSLSGDVRVLTAIANDHAYKDVFTHQLRSQSRPGDVLVAVSSSGRSANIVTALSWARLRPAHDLANRIRRRQGQDHR